MRTHLIASFLLLTACATIDTGAEPEDSEAVSAGADEDHDGFRYSEGDCDDNDAEVNPAAIEQCDGRDNDCDSNVDEGVQYTFFVDLDQDSFGDERGHVAQCTAPEGFVSTPGDCDDNDAAIHPNAEEVCDEVDDDCDGEVDEGVASAWYDDLDGDGFGDPLTESVACDGTGGRVANPDDCDDEDATAFPRGIEVCDLVDNDCDGVVDDGVMATWFTDLDGDGYGVPHASTEACSQPDGYSPLPTDCDDGRIDANPAATEQCDGTDDDCDGTVDEDDAADAPTWYADTDGDGFGAAMATFRSCSLPFGYVSDATDCDDADGENNPHADERCDGDDDDCDGEIDEDAAVDAPSWFADADGDGYGNPDFSTVSCSQPARWVADSTDCDDGEASNNPGGVELCDADDNDCDGAVDEDSAADAATWYADADGDRYGDPLTTAVGCAARTGYVASADDCDDAASGINPTASERCDGVDDDCDGEIDEASAVDASTWHADGDGDGYGDAGAPTPGCSAPSGYVGDASDCDDADPSISPGAPELCNLIDDDCTRGADDGVLGTGPDCPAESCAAVLLATASSPDGTYYLDPSGSGSAEEWTCDMTTDGGGWTAIALWDRIHDGDTSADLFAEYSVVTNTMSRFTEAASSMDWGDDDATTDVLVLEASIAVPNDGEVLLGVEYAGADMATSGTYIYVTAGGSDQNLLCSSDLDFGARALYDAAELSYLPGYLCASDASTDWVWSGSTGFSVPGEISNFRLASFHNDLGAARSSLSVLEVWVR
ncbi:hypothetical protein LBMAG42_48720 [Deltaproteobacteria bacterium]|nr:hypothetical protein LBMAG42_48720 [Deltaproteobacteria bacterium]